MDLQFSLVGVRLIGEMPKDMFNNDAVGVRTESQRLTVVLQIHFNFNGLPPNCYSRQSEYDRNILLLIYLFIAAESMSLHNQNYQLPYICASIRVSHPFMRAIIHNNRYVFE